MSGDRERLRKKLRRLLIKQQWRCCYCRCQLRLTGELCGNRATIEHVRPQALGGSHHIRNLKAACWVCNNQRGRLLSNQIEDEKRKARAEMELVTEISLLLRASELEVP